MQTMYATTPAEVDSTAYEPTTNKPDWWEQYYDHIPFGESMAYSEPVIEQMKDEFEHGRGFAQPNDITRIWDLIEGGPQAFIDDRNKTDKEYGFHTDVVLTFPNYRTAVIWIAEIEGQISDGAWENRQWEAGWSWEDFCNATIKVDQSLESAKGESKGNYWPDLNYKDQLTQFDGQAERMIYFVRASGLDRGYGMDDLMADLEAIEGLND